MKGWRDEIREKIREGLSDQGERLKKEIERLRKKLRGTEEK